MPGVANENCENYYPGDYLPVADLVAGKLLDLGHRLALYLRLEFLDDEIDWNLDISLPKAHDPNGVVSFYTSRGLRTIPLSTLIHSGKKEPVDLDRAYYEVLASPEVCDQYKAMISKPLKGLDDCSFNIFRYSENSGKRIDYAKPLYFDELYLAVFSMTLSSAELDDFVVFPFQGKGDWRGVAFKVPQDVPSQRKKVIEQTLKREIITQPPSIQIAYPPVISKSPDGRALVRRESELMFVVEGTLSDASLEVAMTCSNESENQSFLLSGSDRFVIVPSVHKQHLVPVMYALDNYDKSNTKCDVTKYESTFAVKLSNLLPEHIKRLFYAFAQDPFYTFNSGLPHQFMFHSAFHSMIIKALENCGIQIKG
ncbi:hypothetical protein ACFL6U_22875 [Planctomycetota bacterium]